MTTAELIYPEEGFRSDLQRMGIELGECYAENVIRLKRKIRTTLPFKALAERAKSMGFAVARAFEGEIMWKRLEEEVY